MIVWELIRVGTDRVGIDRVGIDGWNLVGWVLIRVGNDSGGIWSGGTWSGGIWSGGKWSNDQVGVVRGLELNGSRFLHMVGFQSLGLKSLIIFNFKLTN